MKITSTKFSFVLFFLLAGCIDRFYFPVDTDVTRVVVEGHISTEPGPYIVKISQSRDIQSLTIAAPISVRQLLMIDNLGNVDTLKESGGVVGTFYTPNNGMRGVAGRAYKVRFETRDGRIYESKYDTLREDNGHIDSVYHEFKRRTNLIDADGRYTFDDEPYTYGFDVQFSASGIEDDYFHMWNFIGTYQIQTDPSKHRIPCPGVAPDCPPNSGNCGCLSPLPCAIGIEPCDCCTCWVTINNRSPVVPDTRLGLRGVSAGFVPLTPYTFMFKVHAQVDQYVISRQTHSFFKEILAQQQATGSLFQPVTGKIEGNIVQISGEPVEANGIFYATSIKSKSIFINPEDIPNPDFIPPIDPRIYANKKINDNCKKFPESTTTKPSFWID